MDRRLLARLSFEPPRVAGDPGDEEQVKHERERDLGDERQTLRARLSVGALPWRESIDVAAAVADGSYARCTGPSGRRRMPGRRWR